VVLLVTGGVATALKLGGDSEQKAVAAAAAEKDRLQAESKANAAMQRLVAEKLRAQALRAEAEKRADSEHAKAEQQHRELEMAKLKAKQAEEKRQLAVPAPVNRPPVRTSVAKPKSTTEKPKTGSRQIRTSL
jgi:regulator of protease activity HflC (stomatin/prohibitin superfamily)